MQGEIITAETFADIARDIEEYTGHEFSPEDIRRAYYAAGELFVDSMQCNAGDSLPEEEAIAEIARLQKLRPSVIRRAVIISIINA